MEAAAYLNAQDTKLSRELTVFDTPQRLVVSGLYEFPIGPKKQLVSKGAHLPHCGRMAVELDCY
jgi:hypothetical protein